MGTAREAYRKTVPMAVKLLIGSIREVAGLARLFRAQPVDVMQVTSHGYETAGVASGLAGIPTVGVFQTWPVIERFRTRRWLMRYAAQRYKRRVFVSGSCRDAWERMFHLPAADGRVVWNGIDLSRYYVATSRVSRQEFTLLAVGRLHPMKGFDWLIDSLALLRERPFRLILAGSGEEERSLKERALRGGVMHRVTFAGHVEDTSQLYRECDCFVLPSVSHEAAPLALCEALATGVPVITSDFGPLPEMNEHGLTGLVVPKGDVQALAAAIRQLMNEPDLGARMGMEGHRKAQRLFSRERMIREMLSIYQEVAEGARG